MNTHDPRQVIEDLRNHLAMHDRRLAFLFGSGTSSAVNIAPAPKAGQKAQHIPLIPGIEGLTEVCRIAVSDIGKSQADAWEILLKHCEQDGRTGNVENILSKIRVKIEAIGEGEKLLKLDRQQLRSIESTICASIAKTVNPTEKEIPAHTPQDNFAIWVRKVNRTASMEIFTTNYDILLERALEFARVPIFDGFVGTHNPFFYTECLSDENLVPHAKWIRLWKLHGSVNWHFVDRDTDKRIVRTDPRDTGEMILPSHRKYDESRKQPYVAYMDRLSQIMNSEHALLITSGYSFSDEHINAILFGALENRNTANIIALQFQDLDESNELVKTAIKCANLTVIGPNGGVISGKWGRWQLTQPVDNKTYSFIDTAFDSNASLENEGSPATLSTDLEGKMRLGDFNWFCLFLKEMGLEVQ